MKKLYAVLLATALCISVSGCENNEKSVSTTSNVTYTYEEQSITLPAAPKKVVTLSAPLLNMAYAVGGTSLARPSTNSPIPESAKSLPEIGQVSHINIETLVGLKPDLVLGEKGQNAKLESLLQSNKIPYLLINYDGINDNVPLIKFLGKIYSKEEQSNRLIDKYNTALDKIEKEAAGYPPAKVAVLRATGKSVTAETPKSICASMVERLHMNDVITLHKEINMDTKTVPYSLEQLSSDDPDIIFIVTMGKTEEITKKMDEQMRDNPAWSHLQAVQTNRVYFLPFDLFLMNPGLRTPEAMSRLIELAYHNK